jgi:aerotaxis receptor
VTLLLLLIASVIWHDNLLIGSILIGVGVLAVLFASYSIRQSVGVPVKDAIETLRKIAAGDLNKTLKTDRNDELAHLTHEIESMRINLRAMIVDVFVASGSVEKNAADTDSLVATLTKNFAAQSDRVSSISAALEQMSVSIAEVSNTTNAATDFSSQVTLAAESGSMTSI